MKKFLKSHQLYLKALKKYKNIKVERFPDPNLLKVKKSDKYFLTFLSKTPLNKSPYNVISAKKSLTRDLLIRQGFPIPKGKVITSVNQINELNIDFPLVVKPDNQQNSLGVTTNIKTKKDLKQAVLKALDFSFKVIIEKYWYATNYCVLVLENKIIGCTKKSPPRVKGDGKSTIKKLIEKENLSRINLNKIKIDNDIKTYLKNQNYSLKTTLPKNKEIVISGKANWSSGAVIKTIDYKKEFSQNIVNKIIEAAKKIKLTLCSVDLIIKNSQLNLEKDNGVILELNSAPAIIPHHYPTKGKPQFVADKIIAACIREFLV